MHPYNRGAFTHVAQFLLDLACLLAVFGSLIVFKWGAHANQGPEPLIWVGIAFSAVFVSVMNVRRMYTRTTFLYRDRIARYVIASGLYASLFCFVLAPFVQPAANLSLFIGAQGLLSVIVVLGQRLLGLRWLELQKRSGKKSYQCLAIGDADLVEQYRLYMQNTSLLTEFVGYIPLTDGQMPETAKPPEKTAIYNNLDGKTDHRAGTHEMRYAGTLKDLEKVLDRLVVDEVLFALPKDYPADVEQAMLLCEKRGLTVKVVLDLFHLGRAKSYVHSIGTLPVLTYHTVTLNSTQKFLKRGLDICGALVGLLLTGIASLFIVPAIALDSKGPLLFRQQRVGRNGRLFTMLKFRTMIVDADAKRPMLQAFNEFQGDFMFKISKDPRITRVGNFLRKSSLDELPQFFNILRGDMSLVGTRPPLPDEVSKYANEQHRRLSIKPGLTGMWQVSGRSKIRDFDEVCRLDLEYIDHWSLGLDIQILVRTMGAVLRHIGAQ